MIPSDLGLPPKFTSFRTYSGFDQLRTSIELATSHERFQILNAATGSGKSVTAAATAALRGDRWLVLTGTKDLQSQYLNDGLVRRLAYSHRNYPCMPRWDKTGTDSTSDDPDYRCLVPRDRCGYVGDIAAANASQSVVSNYAYWISTGRYSDQKLLGEFDFLVLDEAHGAPVWLAKAMTVTITRNRLYRTLNLSSLPSIPALGQIEHWKGWIQEQLQLAANAFMRLDPDDKGAEKRLNRLVSDLNILVIASDPDSRSFYDWKERWVVSLPDGVNPGDGVMFTPRWGSDFAEKYLFRGIPSVLLMSATVTVDHARYLGIPESEMKYREVPSPFDVRRRPIIWIPTVRVDYRMTNTDKAKLYRRVDQIIEAAIDQGAGNGIIHTGSYERTRELMGATRYAPAVIAPRQDAADFVASLARFKLAGRTGKFAVLASPRLQEGVDLSDDESRWQIILWMPFPDSRDPLVEARSSDPRYKNMVLAEKIKQMTGRSIRNENDYATTIILSNHWPRVADAAPFEIWFRAAFYTIRPDRRTDEIKIKFLTKSVIQEWAGQSGSVRLLG